MSGAAAAADDEIVAYTAAGDRVHVGTVLARGTGAGDGCALDVPVEVSVATSGGLVRMAPTEDCAIVVTALEMDPRHVGGALPDAGPGPGSLADGAGGAIAAHVAPSGATTPAALRKRLGLVWQEAFDQSRTWQAGAQFSVEFQRDQRTGALRSPREREPECNANSYVASVGLADTGTVRTTENTACETWLGERTEDFTDLWGRSRFAHSMASQELVRFRLDGRLMLYRDRGSNFVSTCIVEIEAGTWPQGWYTECSGREDAGGVE